MAQCPNCGCGLLTHERTCPRCQWVLPVRRKRSNVTGWIVAAVVVVALLCLAAWWLGR